MFVAHPVWSEVRDVVERDNAVVDEHDELLVEEIDEIGRDDDAP
jgi:hypothetical protein